MLLVNVDGHTRAARLPFWGQIVSAMANGYGETGRAVVIAICTVITLALFAGGMLVCAVWYLSADINAVSVADNQALAKQWQLFQEAHLGMVQRVTTLESERADDRSGIDHLSVAIDQERAALNDLATAVTKLQAAVDAGQPHRR